MTFIASLLVLGTAGSLWAEQGWQTDLTFLADRDAVDDRHDDGLQLELETRFVYGLKTSRRFEAAGRGWTDLSFGLSRERYPDAENNDRLYLDAELLGIAPLDHPFWTQLRLGAQARHAIGPEGEVYSRMRLSGALRFAPAQRQTVQLRARIGYREQNDLKTFRGYDQHEYLFDVMHLWGSEDWSRRVTTTLYAERRDAEAARFSYDELGLRFSYRQRLDPDTDLVAKTALFTRDYNAGGRYDERFHGSFGIETALTERLNMEAYVGYETNDSTNARKSYHGSLLGMMFMIPLN
ncbi:hypothetical protein CSE45_4772 [Citreicella sp. SE45]|nr:hypothetical protein CSE45_4772 [Citreicella sp. SE45]